MVDVTSDGTIFGLKPGTTTVTAAADTAELAEKAAESEKAQAETAQAELEAIAATLCAGKEFTDVDVNEWYHDAVDFVINEGMMSGNGDSTFAPETELSRAMLVCGPLKMVLFWAMRTVPMRLRKA